MVRRLIVLFAALLAAAPAPVSAATDAQACARALLSAAHTQGIGPDRLDGQSVAFGFGSTGRPSAITAPECQITFGYDACGRAASADVMGGEHSQLSYYGSLATYTPDGRLEDVRRDGVLVAHYEYDANGNRSLVTRGAFSTSYSYDDQDRLLSAGDVGYAYDQAGDLQTRTQGGQVTGYRYDALGNLTGVDLPDGRHVTYTLDALGRRIERKVDGTLTQAFLYAPESQGPVAQLNAAGEIVSRFVYATSASLPDYFTRGGHSYQIIRDDLGSPRLVLDTASGQVAEQLDYDEYGRTVTDTNPALQPFGYAGGLKDTDTGLVQFGARDYDPDTGRWTTKDPIGLQGGDTDLYAYAGGDPINNTDPSGLISGQDVANFGAGFGDALTFGKTRCLRDVLGIADRVDMSSPTYTAGAITAIVVPIPAAAALEAFRAARVSREAAAAAKAGEDVAFHYTRSEVAGLIEKNGLRPGSYLTKSGDLSPLQAQIDLALPPNRGLPDALIRVDLAGMRKAGYDIGDFTQVGRKYNMPGGGTELQFKRAIPPQFVRVVRP